MVDKYSSLSLRVLAVLLEMIGNDNLGLLTISPLLYPFGSFHLKK